MGRSGFNNMTVISTDRASETFNGVRKALDYGLGVSGAPAEARKMLLQQGKHQV